MAFAALSTPVTTMNFGPALPATAGAGAQGSEAAKRASIAKTAKDFEASFVSNMLQPMFEGLDTTGPFSGGDGEAMFRSIMVDAMGQSVAHHGGVGVAAAVQREMLRMQGLS